MKAGTMTAANTETATPNLQSTRRISLAAFEKRARCPASSISLPGLRQTFYRLDSGSPFIARSNPAALSENRNATNARAAALDFDP